MNEIGVEIIKTEEYEESGRKYLNINVSNSEVKRKPDIVRLCANAGIIEYAKQKTGHWIDGDRTRWKCSNCGYGVLDWNTTPYCPNCGAKMKGADE